ncbi:orotidine-5'-phosphate decarboxylase [Cohaesibacter celericrescens]|uniref:Orotidine 5'-phosphate decarboxylase n=1 Tax=Cohaesibacter celericrescens TaxID=2067669 RepID=A0A2N5XPM3_9HYPH|nr:orotidine-5'-phosphate decarboxylase [Cohaesibacter celericrescens]PLW76481.1 orotidine-5'-phosphate decarboxylase [Cohaesibacter celericrescens]
MSISPRDRLIVPLDVPSVDDARRIIDDLGDSVSFYKIGYQLGYAGGFELAQQLIQDGKDVFMDLKLLDIDNTVEKGVGSIKTMGAKFLTVHAYPKVMRAAVAGRGDSDLQLLGVTVLTSMDDEDLDAAGYRMTAAELVAKRAADARAAGMDGIVCSAQEAQSMRAIVGPDMAIVTPGIRPIGSDAGDQKRIMTPARAIAVGADYLVVGRPILGAPSRSDMAKSIIDDIAVALGKR